jgi:hypothetical protein
VSGHDEKLLEGINLRIDEKQEMLKGYRIKLRDRDGVIDFMEFVLKEKQT